MNNKVKNLNQEIVNLTVNKNTVKLSQTAFSDRSFTFSLIGSAYPGAGNYVDIRIGFSVHNPKDKDTTIINHDLSIDPGLYIAEQRAISNPVHTARLVGTVKKFDFKTYLNEFVFKVVNTPENYIASISSEVKRKKRASKNITSDV